MNRIFVFIYLFTLLSFCVAFYIEPSESQQQGPKQHNQLDQPQNILLKETIEEEEVDQQRHFPRGGGNFASEEAEKHLTEKETKHDHSVEDVAELRFPLDDVITQIEEDTNDFHDQELHKQQGDSEDEKEAAPQERAKLTFHPSSADGASSISERRTESDQKGKGSDDRNEMKEANDGRTNANEEFFNGSKTNLNKTEAEKITSKEKEKSEKLKKEADKANDGHGIAKNGSLGEEIGEKGTEQQQQKEGNVRTVSPVLNDANAAQSLPPIIEVAGMAPAESDDRQFSIEKSGAADRNGDTNELLDEEVGASTEEEGRRKAEELTWWDKIVLGLRCARHDCRETLIAGGEKLPRVINGWKVTRRARSAAAAADERKKTFEFKSYCQCQT